MCSQKVRVDSPGNTSGQVVPLPKPFAGSPSPGDTLSPPGALAFPAFGALAVWPVSSLNPPYHLVDDCGSSLCLCVNWPGMSSSPALFFAESAKPSEAPQV